MTARTKTAREIQSTNEVRESIIATKNNAKNVAAASSTIPAVLSGFKPKLSHIADS